MRASSTPSQAQPWWPDGDESQGQRLPTVACAVDASRRLGVHVFPPASWVKMAGGGDGCNRCHGRAKPMAKGAGVPFGRAAACIHATVHGHCRRGMRQHYQALSVSAVGVCSTTYRLAYLLTDLPKYLAILPQ